MFSLSENEMMTLPTAEQVTNLINVWAAVGSACEVNGYCFEDEPSLDEVEKWLSRLTE